MEYKTGTWMGAGGGGGGGVTAAFLLNNENKSGWPSLTYNSLYLLLIIS